MNRIVATLVHNRTNSIRVFELHLRRLFLLWLGVTGLFVTGCTSLSTPTDEGPSKTIAVMPLDNQTNSVAGSLYMREQMVKMLARKGYQPLPIKQTDEMLANQFGISMGGQINEQDIPSIAAALGVEAIMTGRLKNFGAVLLAYNEVSASFILYSGPDLQSTWQPAWSYDGTASTPFSSLYSDDLSTHLIGGLITNMLDRSFGAPLQETVSRYYRQLQRTLPSGRSIQQLGIQQRVIQQPGIQQPGIQQPGIQQPNIQQ